MRRFLAAKLGLAFLGMSGLSHATIGYVCTATYNPYQDGFVSVTYKTQPYCAGVAVGPSNQNYCGTNTDIQYCATGADRRYSTAELLVLLQVLQQAGQNGTKVDFFTTVGGAYCNYAGADCALGFFLRSDS